MNVTLVYTTPVGGDGLLQEAALSLYYLPGRGDGFGDQQVVAGRSVSSRVEWQVSVYDDGRLLVDAIRVEGCETCDVTITRDDHYGIREIAEMDAKLIRQHTSNHLAVMNEEYNPTRSGYFPLPK